MTAPTLVIGIGNPYRGDDAIGLLVIERLRADYRDSDQVRFLAVTADGAEILHQLRNSQRVVIVDAVVSGARPGTIHCRDLVTEPLPRDWSCFSSHAFGLRQAIELARTTDTLSERCQFVGIEVTNVGVGAELSDDIVIAMASLEQAVQDAIATVSADREHMPTTVRSEEL